MEVNAFRNHLERLHATREAVHVLPPWALVVTGTCPIERADTSIALPLASSRGESETTET